MRKTRAAVLGVAALVAVGTAVAATHNSHVMKIAMPDGSIARIEYQGDVAPKVTVTPQPSTVTEMSLPVAFFDPFALTPMASDQISWSPFAELDRMAAQMDREMSAVIHQASAMQAHMAAPDGKLDMAAFGKMPAGAVHYSFVSTSTGNGSCSRSVQVTSHGGDAQPKVVQTSSGDCKGEPGLAPATAPVAGQEPAKLRPVKAEAKTRVTSSSTI
jgi:hypothetical protein